MLLIGGFGLTQVNTDPGKVFRVLAGSPVAAAGMQQGDSIRAVNGKPFTSPGLIQSEEKAAPGAPLTLTGVHSDGRPFTYVVTPICDAQGSCRIGVSVAMKLIQPQTAVWTASRFPSSRWGGSFRALCRSSLARCQVDCWAVRV